LLRRRRRRHRDASDRDARRRFALTRLASEKVRRSRIVRAFDRKRGSPVQRGSGTLESSAPLRSRHSPGNLTFFPRGLICNRRMYLRLSFDPRVFLPLLMLGGLTTSLALTARPRGDASGPSLVTPPAPPLMRASPGEELVRPLTSPTVRPEDAKSSKRLAARLDPGVSLSPSRRAPPANLGSIRARFRGGSRPPPCRPPGLRPSPPNRRSSHAGRGWCLSRATIAASSATFA